ncbi:MAG: glycosyltransferase, partial [Thermoplasmata archaeon]|nr:glycosyltransferase [Thermoplasmata archaeon]
RLLRPAADLLDRVALLMAPSVVTTSARVAERIERFVPGRTFLARLGAPEVEEWVPVGERDRRRVFSVTVWDRGRHPELYLTLARAMPRFHFVLAGIWTDPEHLAEVRASAVTGPVSETERRDLMRRALLYLRVGFHESGPGMGGLEALAAGSLVIANRELGLSEILTDGVDGFVVDRPDPAELAQLLERIDALPAEDLERVSAAARGLAERNSWAVHGRILGDAIRRALEGPTRRRRRHDVGRSTPRSSRAPAVRRLRVLAPPVPRSRKGRHEDQLPGRGRGQPDFRPESFPDQPLDRRPGRRT